MVGHKVDTYIRKTYPRQMFLWRMYSPVSSLEHTREETWPFLMPLDHTSMMICQKKSQNIKY